MEAYILLLLSALFWPSLQHPDHELHEVDYKVEFVWDYINFTWPTKEEYREAVKDDLYIAENIVISGIQYWNEKLFFGLPRWRPGVPITLAYLDLKRSPKNNPLLTMYPNYETVGYSDDIDTCHDRLESVQTLQVDPETGYLWLLDGLTISKETICPPKIAILDLNDHGKIFMSFEFEEHICPNPGCFLNGLRIDKQKEKTFAYISDSGDDPGLIVFCLKDRTAWKLRDATMYANPAFQRFLVDGVYINDLINIDGIALTPSLDDDGYKTLYYSATAAVKVYAIGNDILQNPQYGWRNEITCVGQKFSQGDDMIFDEEGTLYYTLLPLYAVAKWVLHDKHDIIIDDRKNLVWGESFCFDEMGSIRVLSNHILKYADLSLDLKISDTRMTVLKWRTGTGSYINH